MITYLDISMVNDGINAGIIIGMKWGEKKMVFLRGLCRQTCDTTRAKHILLLSSDMHCAE